ncbi:MAG: restriction endonuclease subunit S [Deltaproteobacteria bacterium]|nr:restriction endonuclease subunit S [Deltaproteobacteria bacterium]
MGEEKKIGEVAIVIMGQSPEGETYNREGDGLPLLNGPTEFGPFSPQCTLFTTDSKRECFPGDLLFCVRGSTTGRMNWADQKYSLGRGVCAIRGDAPLATKYLRYCLGVYLPALLNLAGGGTFPNLRKNDIEGFAIPFHKHYEKIASILSAYDDLIENNLRRIKILEEMAQAIYREWFVKFSFPGHEKTRMVDSPMGKIPEGWEVKPLRELTDVITKGTTPTTLGKPFTEEGVNFVKVESVDNHGAIREEKLAKIDTETHALLRRSQLVKDDILYSIAGAIGRVTLVPERVLPANTNQALAIIRSSDPLFVPYLYLNIRSPEFVNFSLGRVVQTAQANVSLSVLSAAPVAFPPGGLLQLLTNTVGPMLGQIDCLLTKDTNLRQTRDLLLPKLISGELDISDLDIKTGGHMQ